MALGKNSWMPVVGLLVTAVLAWFLLLTDYEQGRLGPTIHAGIYPTTERFVPSAPETVLQVTVERTDSSPVIYRADHDRRVALEIVPWDEIGLSVEDFHPLTKALAKALAEDLTGYLDANGAPAATPQTLRSPLVMLQPAGEAPKFPLALRRILRVRTVSPDGAEFDGWQLGQAVTCRMEVALHDVVDPVVAATTGLVASGSVLEQTLTYAVSVAAPSQAIDWPTWHVTVAREVAKAALQDLYRGGVPEQPFDIFDSTTAAVHARHHPALPNDAGAWEQTLGGPPTASVQRWYGVFQQPLVRGWGGAIIGTQVPVTKKGTVSPTIELFEKVMAKGMWDLSKEDEGYRQWKGNESAVFEYTIAQRSDWGWRLSVMERNPQALQVADAWLAQAGTGDATARIQLRRHLLCAGLSEDWRNSAVGILRTDPDAAEVAMLGLLPDATTQERAMTALVHWVRGISDVAPGPEAAVPATAPIGGRPVALAVPGRAAVVTRLADGRYQFWYRQAGGQPQHGIAAQFPTESGLTIDGETLTLNP